MLRSRDGSLMGIAPRSVRASFPGPSPGPRQTANRQHRPFMASVAIGVAGDSQGRMSLIRSMSVKSSMGEGSNPQRL